MDTQEAMLRGRRARSAGNKMKVFDWDTAAKIIKQRRAQIAFAGLSDDWEWTGGCILQDGKPVFDEYTYLASIWATPQIRIGDQVIECWKWVEDTPEWGAGTRLPASALAILQES